MALLHQQRPVPPLLVSQDMRPAKRPRTSWISEAEVPPSAEPLLAARSGSLPANLSTPGLANAGSSPAELSARLRATLGNERYAQTRSAILSHQEVFMGQLFELHRIVQLQRHLVCVCSDKNAVSVELAKLEAEQLQRDRSDSLAEQDCSTEAGGPLAVRPAAELQQASGSEARGGPNAMAPAQQLQQSAFMQPSRMGGRLTTWAAPRPQGMASRHLAMQHQQAGAGPSGRPRMASNHVPSRAAFPQPSGAGFGIDPMMAWYMLHCGQYAQAVHSAAHAFMQAQEELQAGDNRAAEARTKLHWWHDPEKVFGAAANPDVIAGFVSHEQSLPKLDPRTATATKPPSLPGTHTAREGTGDTAGGSSAEGLPSNRQRQEGSLGTDPLASAGTGRKAGSGLSAFKKLPTKSPHMRPPPTRAESIGSEVSRSAAERSHIDEGESSGVVHGSGKADARSGPSGSAAAADQQALGGS